MVDDVAHAAGTAEPVAGAAQSAAPGRADGVTPATRRRVARSILENGPSTAAELAERLEVTPTAIRRHLDALVIQGTLATSARAGRGPRGRGRPAKVFVVTDAGRAEFDQRYDELALSALRFLQDTSGEEAVREFARRRVDALRGALVVEVAARPAADRVHALARALSAQGYAASAEATSSGGAQLCQHHCPVSQVAEEFPSLCEAETALFSELLGTHVQRLATIAHHDGICTTYVPPPAPAVTSERPATPARPETAPVPAGAGTAPSVTNPAPTSRRPQA